MNDVNGGNMPTKREQLNTDPRESIQPIIEHLRRETEQLRREYEQLLLQKERVGIELGSNEAPSVWSLFFGISGLLLLSLVLVLSIPDISQKTPIYDILFAVGASIGAAVLGGLLYLLYKHIRPFIIRYREAGQLLPTNNSTENTVSAAPQSSYRSSELSYGPSLFVPSTDSYNPSAIQNMSSIRIRILEEPLTAQNLTTIFSALTELYTKCWLISKNRFADLSNYTLTHDAIPIVV
jgi:hypothetical protein